jgi:hypothetical protein
VKRLVGKTDVEDALQKLENAITEETRMGSAEALQGIDLLQDRMKVVVGMIEGVGDMLQGLGQKGIDSAQIIVQLINFTIDNVFMVRCREFG